MEAGATVTIVALEEDVAEVAEQLSARYERQVLGISCDIADLSQIDQMQAQVKHVMCLLTMLVLSILLSLPTHLTGSTRSSQNH